MLGLKQFKVIVVALWGRIPFAAMFGFRFVQVKPLSFEFGNALSQVSPSLEGFGRALTQVELFLGAPWA